jgi:uncharacterized membrane protein
MNSKTLALASAFAGALALTTGATAQAGPAEKPDFKFEKCYGVSKAGKNDCQTAKSSCAGTAKKDQQADAWIYLPAGTCGKIDGGSTEPKGA